ncbi:dynein regulatory complex protein 12 [Athene noctua]|uniref:dynein regulatory complex protein 12 n=1 Tax=Athene noctua TaxID=126797 RepID=UPI003EBE81BE
MPLKNKGKGKKGVKQQKKNTSAAESQAEHKYRKAALDVGMPKEHLGPWRDTIWQAKADNEGLKRRLWDLEKALEQAQEDKRDIGEEMARQYQELQKQTAAHSQRLEAKVKSLQEQLAARLRENQQTQEMATRALAERDRTITQLQGRLDATEREYEKILHRSLDLVLAKMAEASQHREELGTTIAMEHKERLQEFGLNPLEIQHPEAPRAGQALSPYLPVSTLGELPPSSAQHPRCPRLGKRRWDLSGPGMHC